MSSVPADRAPTSAPVRVAEPADADAIADVAIRSWREGYRGIVPDRIDPARAWSSEWIRSRLEGRIDDGSRTLVAQRGEEVAGFIVFGPCRDDDVPDGTGEIWALYVDPHRWRMGVGTALAEAALAGLGRNGLGRCTVWTLAESRRNLLFYEALGFRLDGAEQRRESFGSPLEVRLRRPLR